MELINTKITYVEGPKWAGLKQFLYSLGSYCNVDITIVSEDKGWLTTAIYYKGRGTWENLKKFSQMLKISMDQYNAD